MQKWEYLFIDRRYDYKEGDWYWRDNRNLPDSINERLEYLGQDGWELVSVTSLISRVRNLFHGESTRLDFYFKRPIEK